MERLPTVLLVDDAGSLHLELGRLVRERLDLIVVKDATQATAVARRRRVHVMVVQQGAVSAVVETVRQVRACSPCTLAIVLAAGGERGAILGALDEHAVFRIAHRPCDAGQLQGFVELAVDQSRAFFAASSPGATDPAPCVLVLDEETATAEHVREALRRNQADWSVHWCDTLYEAFDALANRRVGLLVSDLRLDGEEIGGGLRALRACHPEVPLLIFSSVKDTDSIADLLEDGCQLLQRPAGREALAQRIGAALKSRHFAFSAVHARSSVPFRTTPAARTGGPLRAFLSRWCVWPDSAGPT